MLEKETKKLPRVEGTWTQSQSPYNSRLAFSLVSSPKNGRKQCITLVTCRDFIHDSIRDHVNDTRESSYYHPGVNPSIDMDKMRLLVSIAGDPEITKRSLFSGKRVLNIYENLAGWKPSVISTVKHNQYKNAWLITGPKEWMNYSAMLSMVTLILRVSVNHGPIEATNIEELSAWWKNLIEKPPSPYGDINYIVTTHDKFRILVEHYDKIFIKGYEEAYPKNTRVPFHGGGGIVSLCTYTSGLGELDERFKKIVKKYSK